MAEQHERFLHAKAEIQQVDPRLLSVHPRNAIIRGKKRDEAVRESIRLEGIKSPLECTEYGVVYKGAGTRLPMALELGMETVPVIVTALTDEIEIEKALIADILHSDDNICQRARIFQAYKKIEQAIARDRQREGAMMTNARLGRKSSAETLRSNVIEASCVGKASDHAATMAGMKPTTAEKSLKVITAIDLALAHEMTSEAHKIVDCLNQSVLCGFKEAMNLGIHREHINPRQLQRLSGHTMLAQWQWDPLTGCAGGCMDCPIRTHAQAAPAIFLDNTPDFAPQLERRQKIFAPFFHRNRLYAPMESDMPDDAAANSPAYHMLTCWGGDLFGPGISTEWREEILMVMRASANARLLWRFLLRTCHPEEMLKINWPANVDLGIYLWRKDQIIATMAALRKLRRQFPTHHTFLTVPPRAELLHFTSLADCSYLYLGDFPTRGSRIEKHDHLTTLQYSDLRKQIALDHCRLIVPTHLRLPAQDEEA